MVRVACWAEAAVIGYHRRRRMLMRARRMLMRARCAVPFINNAAYITV